MADTPSRSWLADLFPPEEDVAVRGGVLPLVRTHDGRLRPGLSEDMRSVWESVRLPGRALRGEQITDEEIADFGLNVGLLGGAGSIARGAVRGVPDAREGVLGVNGGNAGKGDGKPYQWTGGDLAHDGLIYSPSRLAAYNLKQPRAGSWAEMRKALIAGGAKEKELAWIGADEHFGGRQGPVTQEEVKAFMDQHATKAFTRETADATGYRSVEGEDFDEDYARERWRDSEYDYYYEQATEDFAERFEDLTAIEDMDDDEIMGLMAGDPVGRRDAGGDPETYRELFGERRHDPSVDVNFRNAGEYTDFYSSDIEENASTRLGFAERDLTSAELRDYMGYDSTESDLERWQNNGTTYSDYFPTGLPHYVETVLRYQDPMGVTQRAPENAYGHRVAGVEKDWNAATAQEAPALHIRGGVAHMAPDNRQLGYFAGEAQSDWATGARAGGAPPLPFREEASFASLRDHLQDIAVDRSGIARGRHEGFTEGPLPKEDWAFNALMDYPNADLARYELTPEQLASVTSRARAGAEYRLAKGQLGELEGAPMAAPFQTTDEQMRAGAALHLNDALQRPEVSHFTTTTGDMAQNYTFLPNPEVKYGSLDGSPDGGPYARGAFQRAVDKHLGKLAQGTGEKFALAPTRIVAGGRKDTFSDLDEVDTQQVMGVPITDRMREEARRKGLSLWQLMAGGYLAGQGMSFLPGGEDEERGPGPM